MINTAFVIVLGVFSLVYAGINYYIGLRAWQGVFRYLPFLHHKAYWVVFWFIALAYLVGRVAQKFLPAIVSHFLTLIGSYWMGVMFYALLILVPIELLRFLNRFVNFLPKALSQGSNPNPVFGLAVLAVVVGIVLYGLWNAKNPVVQKYNLTIDKKAGTLQELHIVMVSDIHLGTLVGKKTLDHLVDMVNEQNPDIILLAGDVIDESVEPFVEQQMGGSFHKLKAKFGTYAVLGNHEYIGGHADEMVKHLQEAGITVLRDESELVAASFYVVGREDSSRSRFGGGKRKPLDQLMVELNKSLPIILLDHQPSNLSEPEGAGVDLQLSGHTHRGQLFPNQLITQRIFEDDWGLLVKNKFHIIVSSGFGTWGPPIRVGNKPELVDIRVNFKK